MAVYRNQTDTLSLITRLSHIRITTVQEATAYLRAVQPLNEQVAQVLQRQSIRVQQEVNRNAMPTPAPTPVQETPVAEPEKKFEAEDLSSDEGYSEKEVEARVEKLKKAKETEEKPRFKAKIAIKEKKTDKEKEK